VVCRVTLDARGERRGESAAHLNVMPSLIRRLREHRRGDGGGRVVLANSSTATATPRGRRRLRLQRRGDRGSNVIFVPCCC
jgi:hypothetical protein